MQSVIGKLVNVIRRKTKKNEKVFQSLQLRTNGNPIQKISGTLVFQTTNNGVKELCIEMSPGEGLYKKQIKVEDRSKRTYNLDTELTVFVEADVMQETDGRLTPVYFAFEEQNLEKIIEGRKNTFPILTEVKDYNLERSWEKDKDKIIEIEVLVSPYISKAKNMGFNYRTTR